MTETLTLPTHADARRGARIPVAVLGATGSVGQRFVQLLEAHPWFRLAEVVASERSAGRSYGDAADWRLDTLLPASAASLEVKPLGASLESRLVFSGLDSSVAGEAEDDLEDSRQDVQVLVAVGVDELEVRLQELLDLAAELQLDLLGLKTAAQVAEGEGAESFEESAVAA